MLCSVNQRGSDLRVGRKLTAVYDINQTKKSCSTRYLAAAIVSDRLISADKAS